MDVQFFLVVFVFLLAGLVKGVTGMGLPTVAMGLLTVFMSPVAAASLMLLPSLLTNIAQGLRGLGLLDLLGRFSWLLLAIFLFSAAATVIMTNIGADWVETALGTMLIGYAGYSLAGRSFQIARYQENWLSPVVGVITGLITGATGVFVMPVVPYLQSLNLDKDQLVQTLGLSFTASTLGLWLGLIAQGALRLEHALHSSFALVPALLGMYLGNLLRARMNTRTFRACFLISLLALGCYMVVR